jgi:cell division topological specificity factor
MFDFFSRFFRRDGSSATAKERLRLVLLSDHLSLAPETVDALKRELIEVISRYVKIDSRLCDVSFEQQASTVAMHANIPILGLQNDRPTVAPPVLVDAPRGSAALAAEDPGYLDAIHDEHRKSGGASPKSTDNESATNTSDEDAKTAKA